MKTILILAKDLILWVKHLFVKKEQSKQFIPLDPWDDEHFGDNIHFT